jgi:thymidylate synthase ThyX
VPDPSGRKPAEKHLRQQVRVATFSRYSAGYSQKGFCEAIYDPKYAFRRVVSRADRDHARFVLPNACVSEIVVSADFREWRHIFKLRTSAKAQWEIRKACLMMLAILKEQAGACFSDIEVEGQ